MNRINKSFYPVIQLTILLLCITTLAPPITRSATSSSDITVSIDTSNRMIHPGEEFSARGYIVNNSGVEVPDAVVVFMLSAFGEYYFWPDWVHFDPADPSTFRYEIRDIRIGQTVIPLLEPFQWPETGYEAQYGLLFYGAVLSADMTSLVSNLAVETWGYSMSSTWLDWVNIHRWIARLPPVYENVEWSQGNVLHARYMVKNDYIGHSEDSGNAWYTAEGDAAARNSDLMVSSLTSATDQYAVDLWMTAPFHAVGIIDPELRTTGYGSYREADGGWQMGAGLDVLRGLGEIPSSVQYPIVWPSNGSTIHLTSYNSEYPDPLTSCPGFTAPAGLPLIVQLGSGNVTPDVTDHSFFRGETPLEHCIFDETNFTHPDGSQQSLARSILNSRDAIILIPRTPLLSGAIYTASITTNGQVISWSFTVE